jgi:hypothetical protein
MPILGILASGRVKYSLAATYTSSATFTVPAGVSRIAVFAVGSGGSGSSGASGATRTGGYGGAGSPGVFFKDYVVTPGATFSVSTGGSGASTFGNSYPYLANSGYGSGQTPISGSSTVSGWVGVGGVSGGDGGVNTTVVAVPTEVYLATLDILKSSIVIISLIFLSFLLRDTLTLAEIERYKKNHNG